jgi:hypothetical protein
MSYSGFHAPAQPAFKRNSVAPKPKETPPFNNLNSPVFQADGIFCHYSMCLQLHFTKTNFMNPNTTGDDSRNHTALEP